MKKRDVVLYIALRAALGLVVGLAVAYIIAAIYRGDAP